MTKDDKNIQNGISDETRLAQMRQALILSIVFVLIALELLYFFIYKSLASHRGWLEVLLSWKIFLCGVLLMMAAGAFQTYKGLKNAKVEGGFYLVNYNQIRWLPNEETLPMRSTIKSPLSAGIIMTLLGAGFVGFLLWNYIGGTIKQGFSLQWTMVFFLFNLLPLMFFLGGLSMIFGRKHIEISSENITYSAKGIFISKDWKEPISNYEGIATRVWSSPKFSNQYFVELRHKKDISKDIQLWQSWGQEGQADAQVQFSRLLNLAAL